MRAAHLSVDRRDLAEAAKTSRRSMKSPMAANQADMKRLGRYIVPHRCLVSRFESQSLPTEVTVIVDSDRAGRPVTRKSTSGISR
eukprot:8132587-Pyramimonas_sp.AAC.1